MKLLIAHNGSASSEAALLDLHRAGLPAVCEAIVLSVAETPGGHHLQEARNFAAKTADKLRAEFPKWHIKSESAAGSAGPVIVEKAADWKSDLIITGSHGHSRIHLLVLGSVPKYVLQHTACSLRISRHRVHSQKRPTRLLVGVDGSDHSKMTVKAVAARSWAAGTESLALCVLDSRIAIGAAVTPSQAVPADIEEENRRQMSKAVHDAAKAFEKSGLIATQQILTGHPGEVILAEAEKWAADCVFVGVTSLNRVERLLSGNVSMCVASRAHCTVEVVV